MDEFNEFGVKINKMKMISLAKEGYFSLSKRLKASLKNRIYRTLILHILMFADEKELNTFEQYLRKLKYTDWDGLVISNEPLTRVHRNTYSYSGDATKLQNGPTPFKMGELKLKAEINGGRNCGKQSPEPGCLADNNYNGH